MDRLVIKLINIKEIVCYGCGKVSCTMIEHIETKTSSEMYALEAIANREPNEMTLHPRCLENTCNNLYLC